MKQGPSNLSRKYTAVGTIGDVGASYAVFENNWICTECENENFARRERCYRCRAPKPERKDALVVLGAGENNPWREAVDPASKHIYYYNTKTRETQWERPIEMGPAPHSTGWFGRGAAGHDNSNKYAEKNKVYMKRPARKQIDQLPTKNSRLEGAFEYNIWYDKYIGDHWAEERGKEPAETRCVLESDAGFTKADSVKKTNRYFCVHFARGMCARGEECSYFHRLPTREDEVRVGMMHDCFGRDRHATDRDDMSGTGNFTRNSRTLYVGGIQEATSDQQVMKHFGEWGEVENVNVIHRLSICFVRFRHRIAAEFAKEAMTNQALDGSEILDVRWAFDDPNPVAKEANQRADHDAIVGMLKAKGISSQPAEFNYPETYQLQPSKRQRTVAESKGIAEYPDTDSQYKKAAEQLSYAATDATE